MPTYNNGSKLEHTIHSVLQQTMDKSDFEFIIIDDHSNDNKTVEIIRHYLVKYPELIKFKQLRKNSGNASIPRNHGIKMSKAEYIFFLDSDDLLHPNTLSDLYHYGLKHNSDLIIGKYGVQGKGRGVSKAAFEKGNIPQADIIENSLFYTLSVLKMFKRSVIVKQKFMFKTNAKTAEDQLFTIEFLMNSKKYSIKTDYEYYIQTKVSLNHTFLQYLKYTKLFIVVKFIKIKKHVINWQVNILQDCFDMDNRSILR